MSSSIQHCGKRSGPDKTNYIRINDIPCQLHSHLGVGGAIVVPSLPVGVCHDGSPLQEAKSDGAGVGLGTG